MQLSCRLLPRKCLLSNATAASPANASVLTGSLTHFPGWIAGGDRFTPFSDDSQQCVTVASRTFLARGFRAIMPVAPIV